jgi:hypothetical protein
VPRELVGVAGVGCDLGHLGPLVPLGHLGRLRTRKRKVATMKPMDAPEAMITPKRCMMERGLCRSRRQKIRHLSRATWAIPSMVCRPVVVQTQCRPSSGKEKKQDSLHCEVAPAVLGQLRVLARTRFVGCHRAIGGCWTCCLKALRKWCAGCGCERP